MIKLFLTFSIVELTFNLEYEIDQRGKKVLITIKKKG